MYNHLKSCHYVHRGLSTRVLYDMYLVQNIWAYDDMYQTLMCRQMGLMNATIKPCTTFWLNMFHQKKKQWKEWPLAQISGN